MLEPLTAIALAGNILQFLDFGIKATSKAREIHTSASGALEENAQLEYLIEHVSNVMKKLEANSGHDGLDDICRRCVDTAAELLEALNGLKVYGQPSKAKSVRKALKSVWGKQKLEGMRSLLVGLRDEIQFSVLIDLRSSIDAESARHHDRFDELDDYSKAILEALSTGQDLIQDAIQREGARSDELNQETMIKITAKQESIQVAMLESVSDHAEAIISTFTANNEGLHEALRTEGERLGERHRETTAAVASRQEELHEEAQHSLEQMNANSREDHEATRRELEQMKMAMQQIVEDIARRDEELKSLLADLNKSHSPNERKKLKERSNAVTVALCALVTIYEALQKLITSLNVHAKSVLTGSILSISWSASTKGPYLSPQWQPVDGVLNKIFTSTHFCRAVIVQAILNDIVTIESRQALTQSGVPPASKFRDILYHKIGENTVLDPKIFDQTEFLNNAKEDVVLVLSYLAITQPKPSPISGSDSTFWGGPLLEDEAAVLLHTLVILTTILVESLGTNQSAVILMLITFPTPLFNFPPLLKSQYLAPFSTEDDMFRSPGVFKGNISTPPLQSIYEGVLRRVIGYSAVGEILGYKSAIADIIKWRFEKWGIEKPVISMLAIRDFLDWFIDKPHLLDFSFEIQSQEQRSRNAILYAIVDCLVKFRFPLTSPMIHAAGSLTRTAYSSSESASSLTVHTDQGNVIVLR